MTSYILPATLIPGLLVEVIYPGLLMEVIYPGHLVEEVATQEVEDMEASQVSKGVVEAGQSLSHAQ